MFYIHCADDINKQLFDTESDFNIHIEEVGGDEELLIQICNLLNKQQSRLGEEINMTENALITKADLLFDDIGGRNGRNFKLTLALETIDGGVTVNFNPMRLPQLLEQLGLEKFSALEGTYVQIPKTRIGEQVKGIKSIMAKNNEKWFKTENHIYFGSEFFKGYGDSV